MNPTLQAAHDLFSQEPDPNRPRKGESFFDWANRRSAELFFEGLELQYGRKKINDLNKIHSNES